MKVISVNNQQSQNRPVAFGDLVGLVAGDGTKLGKGTAALAFRLTEKDLPRNGHLSREVFRRERIDSDVLQVGVKEFDGIFGKNPPLFVNHKEVFGSEQLTQTQVKALKEIKAILRRITSGFKGIYVAGKKSERDQMHGFLQSNGNFNFQQGQLADDMSQIQSVARLLFNILEKADALK